MIVLPESGEKVQEISANGSSACGDRDNGEDRSISRQNRQQQTSSSGVDHLVGAGFSYLGEYDDDEEDPYAELELYLEKVKVSGSDFYTVWACATWILKGIPHNKKGIKYSYLLICICLWNMISPCLCIPESVLEIFHLSLTKSGEDSGLLEKKCFKFG